MCRFHKEQNGSATIINAGILSFFSFFILSIITLSNVATLKIYTQKSADLSALSASQRLIYLKSGECEIAKRISSFNNVNLENCTKLSSYKVKVVVSKNSIFGYRIKSTAVADK